MGIGNVRGKAIDSGGAGGSFDRQSLAWLAQKGTLYGDPGAAPTFDATGGTTTTYTDPNGEWKSHKFNASGSLVVACLLYTSPSPRDS